MDKKYVAFVGSSVVKLLIYLLLCAGVYFVSGFADPPLDSLIPPIAAAFLCFVFLSVIEEGKRSFFSKGYCLENVVPGAAAGGAVYVIIVFAAFLKGDFSFTGLENGFDLTETFLRFAGTYLFAAIAIYGYFFHIVQKDFGSITAVILSSVLYALFFLKLTGGLTILADGVTASEGVYAASFLLTGVIAGLLIVRRGDMRSASAFLFLYGLCVLIVEGSDKTAALITYGGDHQLSTGLVSVMVSLMVIIYFIISIIVESRDK